MSSCTCCGRCRCPHDMLNIVQAAVLVMVVLAVAVVMRMLMVILMMVFMLVVMVEHLLGLLFAVDSHRHVRAADAAFDRVLADVLHAGDPQRVQFLYKALRIGQQLQQSSPSACRPPRPCRSRDKAFSFRPSNVVDHAGEVARTEAVVDIHNGHAARAGVEHRQQRRNAPERRAVAHARRHRDDRAVGKTSGSRWRVRPPCQRWR